MGFSVKGHYILQELQALDTFFLSYLDMILEEAWRFLFCLDSGIEVLIPWAGA